MDTELNRTPFWIMIMVLSAVLLLGSGIVFGLSGTPTGLGVIPVVIGLIGLVMATATIRPKSRQTFVAFVIAIGATTGSALCVSPMWNSAFGEPTDCQITARDFRPSNKGSSTYGHEVTCAGENLEYTNTTGYAGEVGSRVELVVDTTGIMKPLAQKDISPLRTWIYLGTVAVTFGWIYLVITRPRRKSAPQPLT